WARDRTKRELRKSGRIEGLQEGRKEIRNEEPTVSASALSRQNLNLLDDIPFENPIDHLDAVEHLRENRVLVIEARVVHEVDEDLRVAGVTAARRDADGASYVRPQADLVAHLGRMTHVLVRARTPALDDEVR